LVGRRGVVPGINTEIESTYFKRSGVDLHLQNIEPDFGQIGFKLRDSTAKPMVSRCRPSTAVIARR